jgi:hypothetical protein
VRTFHQAILTSAESMLFLIRQALDYTTLQAGAYTRSHFSST